MKKVLSIIIIVTSFILENIQARCCMPRPISCYDCISTKHVNCKDPFNRSALPEDHPPTAPCNGCCVKWVRHSRTPQEIIQRSCISQFHVNLFMVDRACMQDRGKTGHLCFCEEDLCNHSSGLDYCLSILVTGAIFMLFYIKYIVSGIT